MRNIELTILALLSTALPLLGCSSEPAGSTTPPPVSTGTPDNEEPAAGPTFHKDVAPILQEHCQSCHAPGQIAPFSLLTYADAKAVDSLIVARTKDRSMPPWSTKETEECKPRFGWRHDPRLSEAEIATLESWKNAGSPEGKPSDAPPAELPTDGKLTKIDLTVQPQKPFVASGDKDQFICFVIDPQLTKDTYISGSQVVPGNLKVAHHGVIFVDPNGESAALANADGYYDCFSGPGIKTVQVLAPWVPGARPAVYPKEAGMLLPKGAKLVLQMHYHPAGTTAAPDQSKLDLQFHPGVPEYKAIVIGAGNFPSLFPNGDGLQPGPNDTDKATPEFMIPASVKDHTEAMKYTLPKEVQPGVPLPEMKIYDAFTHMHYIGTDMKIAVHRPEPQNAEPADECVVQTSWDFNWQQTYAYDAPVDKLPTLRGGDVLDLRCTYDNTLDNPFLKRALMEAKLDKPQDVHLGESTLDEMCVGALTVLVKN